MLQNPRSLLLIVLAVAGIGAGLALLYEEPAPSCGPIPPPPDAPFLIAARGAPDHEPSPTWVGFTMSGVFENTLPAFDRARARGLDALDFAVRLTKDEALVLIEDEDVTRTTNSQGLVSALSAEELAALDAGGGASIPTAEQVFELYSDRVTYHIRIPEGGDEGIDIGEALGTFLNNRLAREKTWVFASDAEVLVALRRAAPSIKTGLILPKGGDVSVARSQIGACVAGVELPAEAIDEGVMSAAREAGVWVFASEVSTADGWSKLRGLGVSAGLTPYTSLKQAPPNKLPPQGEVEVWP